MKTLILFLSAFLVCPLAGAAQYSLETDYFLHPKFSAQQYNVKTREVIACSGNLINSDGDTTLEQYSRGGGIVMIRYRHEGGAFSADQITMHKFTYDQKARILTDSTWLNGKLLIKNYTYDDKHQQAEVITYPNWADSSVKVIFCFRDNRICSEVGIDVYGDTVYRYKKNGDTETEQLWKRYDDSLRLVSYVCSVYNPETRTKAVMSYDIAGDRTPFRLERSVYDSQLRLVRFERYENGSASLVEEVTYASENNVAQKTEYTYTDSTVSIVKILYSYSGRNLTSMNYYLGNSEMPFKTIEYLYDKNGLLTEQKTRNSEGKVTKCYSYRYSFY